MQIRFTINDFAVRKRLSSLAAQGHSLRPLMQDIGEEVRRIVEKNFDAGGRPEKWKPTARSKREGGKPLTDKGILRRSIAVDADDKSVRVGTNVLYGGIHQFGGQTAAHEIRPKNKAALSWPGAGHPVRVVHHPGSKIPARPFLVIPDDEHSRIVKIAEAYLGGIFK